MIFTAGCSFATMLDNGFDNPEVEYQMEGPATVNECRLKTRRVPGITYFPADKTPDNVSRPSILISSLF